MLFSILCLGRVVDYYPWVVVGADQYWSAGAEH
jgi:hypothetical protein